MKAELLVGDIELKTDKKWLKISPLVLARSALPGMQAAANISSSSVQLRELLALDLKANKKQTINQGICSQNRNLRMAPSHLSVCLHILCSINKSTISSLNELSAMKHSQSSF